MYACRKFTLALTLLPVLAGAADLTASNTGLAPSATSGTEFFENPFDFFLGRHLFERETFGGNGRTCLTCHSRETGTVSPQDARRRFAQNPLDPLFKADGSDDGLGNGASRMLEHATVLVNVPLAPNVRLLQDPTARSVVLPRSIPSTLNTPALEPVLMQDGRQPDLVSQARGAILDHAQPRRAPRTRELELVAAFQHTPAFFSSPTTLAYAYAGIKPKLPAGRTPAEVRGRRFFVDAPLEGDFKNGICAHCHSGPMLNETNEFVPFPPFRRGGRFATVGVSEMNIPGNPMHQFEFTNPDGTKTVVSSPDPGRALVNGSLDFESLNAFRIPSLWGAPRTAPYFHDNSARTLDEVAAHYARLFASFGLVLTEQEQRDMVAYMKLLK
jgi:cytochrome c peroxidase